METKLDTAKIGEYLGGCVSTAAANGTLAEFTFTNAAGAVINIIEGSEVVIADGTQQERAVDYTFVGGNSYSDVYCWSHTSSWKCLFKWLQRNNLVKEIINGRKNNYLYRT